MTLRQDTPFGQMAAYVEGLEIDNEKLISDKLNLEKQLEAAKVPTWQQKADKVLLIADALDRLGIPYVFGGETIKGMDCSGFVQFIYKFVGLNMPRVSRDQAKIGTQLNPKNPAEWRAGDLIAFDYSGDGVIDHIGIYRGDGTMIHTNTPATGINIKAVAPAASLVSVNRVF